MSGIVRHNHRDKELISLKKFFQHMPKVGRPSRRTKRYLAAIVALLLTLTLSATALADSGAGHGGLPRQNEQQGRMPQGTPDPDYDGQGSQNGQPNGARNVEMNNMNTDKIAEAIAALTDETVKESLTALLDAYESAIDERQAAVEAKDTADLSSLNSAVAAAKTALDEALETAGISTDDLYGVPELAQDGTGRMENRPVMDTAGIAAAIDALDDTNGNKSELAALLKAYEDALQAQNGADVSGKTQEEIDALKNAANKAEQALEQALKNAGIAEEPIRAQNQQQIAQNQPDTGAENQYRITVISEETDGETGTSNLFTSFFQWLNGLFQ